MKEIKVFIISNEGNNCIVKMPDRSEPGIVMQGDTLQQLVQDVEEIANLVKAKKYLDLEDEITALSERLNDILFWYKKGINESD